MKKISYKLLCVILAVTFLLAGCQQQADSTTKDDPGKAILDQNTNTSAKVDSDYMGLAYYANENINPVTTQSKVNYNLCQLLYEGMFVLDNSFQPQNLLCQSWSSQNGQRFDFTLRQGVKFWSGKELTAEDVCYSLKLAKTSALYQKRLAQAASIQQTGTYTLTITLSAVNYDFVSMLDIPVFRKGTESQTFADGTGPYQPQVTGDTTKLTVFSGWHEEQKPQAYPIIDLISVSRTDALLSSFETGDVSMTPLDRLGTAGQSVKGALDVYKTPTTDMHFLVFNQNRPVFQNPLVRQALSELLDRKTLCSNQLQDYATPSVLPVNPQPEGYALDYSVKDAAAKLKEAGIADTDGDNVLEYKNEKKRTVHFRFTVLVNQENEYKVALLNRYAEDLKAAGIQMQVEAVPYAEYEKRLASRSFDMAYCETILTPDFNLTPLLAAGGALNYGGTTGLESLMAAARAYPAGEQQTAAKKALYDGFLKTMPVLVIGCEQQQTITRNHLAEGIDPIPTTIFHGIENWTKNK